MNSENMQNKSPSNYLTYINTKLINKRNNFQHLKIMNNIKDKSESIRSALIDLNINKDFTKTKNFLTYRKQKNKLVNNNNDSLNNKVYNNNSSLYISDIKSNRLQKVKNEEKTKLSKIAKMDEQNITFGTIDKNKKKFYLSVEFSQKIDNINLKKNKKILNHHFPIIKNNK